MKIFPPSAGVTAGFSVAPGADMRNSERHQTVAQPRRFAGRKRQPNIRETNAERADQLREFAIGQLCQRLKLARVWSQPRKRNGDLRLPTLPQQIFRLRRKRNRLTPPFT